MYTFRTFLESEEEDNVKDIISKLPKSHQKLLKGFKVTFTPGNVLKGDEDHIGYIHKNKIVVAAPWVSGRSFVFLHETGHLVFEKLVTPKLRKEWSELIKRTKSEHIKNQPKKVESALKQNDEEIFCNSYANFYTKHRLTTYDHPEWMEFIKKLP